VAQTEEGDLKFAAPVIHMVALEKVFRQPSVGAEFKDLDAFVSLVLAKMDPDRVEGKSEGHLQHEFYAAAHALLPPDGDVDTWLVGEAGVDEGKRKRVGVLDFKLCIKGMLFVLELLCWNRNLKEPLERYGGGCMLPFTCISLLAGCFTSRFTGGGKYASVPMQSYAVIEFDVEKGSVRERKHPDDEHWWLAKLSEDEGRPGWDVTHGGKTWFIKMRGVDRALSST